MADRKRSKIDKGIYRDQWGIAVIVNVGTVRRELRFPLGTEPKTLREKRDELRVSLRKIEPTATRGTFAADAARYLKAVAAMPTIKDRERDIALWWSRNPATGRGLSIKPDEIRAVLERWRLGGLRRLPSTIAGRRYSTCGGCWTVAARSTPSEDVPKQREPEPEARALSYGQIEAILAEMPDVGQGLRGKGARITARRRSVCGCSPIPASRPHSCAA